MGFFSFGRKADPIQAYPVAKPGFMATHQVEHHSFADHLLKSGLISQDAALAAISEQGVTKERIGAILVRNGFLSQEKLVPAILAFRAERIATEQVDTCRIPIDMLERMRIIISAVTDDTVYVGTASPEQSVEALVKTYYPDRAVQFVAYLPDLLPEFIERLRRIDAQSIESADDLSPRAVLDRLLYSALKLNASDIHIEPGPKAYSVFFRILGERRLVHSGTIEEYQTVTAQVKNQGSLDNAERRLPQDGSFHIESSGKFIDLRINTLPTVDGEKVTIRVLDPDKVNPKLEELGIARIDHWIRGMTRQNGLCLVCGPTGSGKTTTLNSSIRHLDRFGKSIYTIEDPVEFRIPFVGQVSVNPAVGLDFARGMRAFMRADPDVIVLGEVRDAETAANAVKAADTGHMVLATLHTGSIQSSVARLRDLEIEPKELRFLLRAVLVQQLVKVVCSTCHGSGEVNHALCPSCAGGGYDRRTVISECMSFNDVEDVDKVIRLTDGDEPVFDKLGWPTMLEDALDLLKRKQTTIDEMRKVFGVIADEKVREAGLDPDDYVLKRGMIDL